MSRVVLGGGLGGLSAAYYLTKKVPFQAITLIESSSRTGGWIKSSLQPDGTIFEQGPRTIRPAGEAGANTLKLVEDLDLSNQIAPIVSSHPAAKNRIIYAKGALHTLPTSVVRFFKQQEPFTRSIGFHMMKEFAAKKKQVHDESIYDFTERRFGTEIADYLVSPLMCGVCAGNAHEISVKFFMKKMFELEQQYGSITRGAWSLIFQKRQKPAALSKLGKRARKEKWSIYSFINGCEVLPLAMKDYLLNHNVNIKLNTSCKGVKFEKSQVIVQLDNNETITADSLVSALPSSTLGTLIQEQHPDLANYLKQLVKNVSVAVVNLQFKDDVLKNPGFGVLVPPKEKLPILGIIYDSCCFPQTNPGTVLTVMMGGYWFEEHFGKDPPEKYLLNVAVEQVQKILSIKADPEAFKVNILRECLPQYIIGHDDTLNHINCYIKTHKLPISLCGSSYNGVGINDVILSAKNAVNEIS